MGLTAIKKKKSSDSQRNAIMAPHLSGCDCRVQVTSICTSYSGEFTSADTAGASEGKQVKTWKHLQLQPSCGFWTQHLAEFIKHNESFVNQPKRSSLSCRFVTWKPAARDWAIIRTKWWMSIWFHNAVRAEDKQACCSVCRLQDRPAVNLVMKPWKTGVQES